MVEEEYLCSNPNINYQFNPDPNIDTQIVAAIAYTK
jgi:hypothetical protein